MKSNSNSQSQSQSQSEASGALLAVLQQMPDPRSRVGLYTMAEVAFVPLCAILAGMTTVVDMADWAEANLEWLREWLPYTAGAPSHDTLSRVLGMVPAGEVEAFFREAMQHVVAARLREQVPEGLRHVAIDGKSVNGVRGEGPRVHLVHAWDVTLQTLLGWRLVAAKHNEIVEIPDVLKRLDLSRTVVTMDAMGTQRDILAKVVAGGGHAIMALKDNQPGLAEAVALYFKQPPKKTRLSCCEDSDGGHGRLETRKVTVLELPTEPLARNGMGLDGWPGLASVVRVESTRSDKASGDTSTEARYYVSTLPLREGAARRQATLIRDHWQVEVMHHDLDVGFLEDGIRFHDRRLTHTLAGLRRLAKSILDLNPASTSTRRRMHAFCWRPASRNTLLRRYVQGLLPPQPPKVIRAIAAP